MKSNLAIARALMAGPCLALAPDGELNVGNDGLLKVPPRVTAREIERRKRFAAARRKGGK